MQPALNCRSLNADLKLEQLLDVASAAEFEGIEVKMADVCAQAEQTSWDATRNLFAMRKIKPINFIDGMYPGLLAPPDKYDEALKTWTHFCKAASLINCKMALVIINPRTDESPSLAMSQSILRLRELAKIAMDWGVTIAIEALGIKKGISPRLDGKNYFMDRYSQSVELAESSGVSNIGVILDAFHWHVSGGSLDEIDATPDGRLVLFQISDAPAGVPSELRDSQRVLPGEGVIDLPTLLKASRGKRFDGYVSLEIFNEQIWAMEAMEAAKRSVKTVKHFLESTS